MDTLAAQLPTLNSLKSSDKKEATPTNPHIKGWSPQGEWTKTHAGIQFLMAEDSEGADMIIVFVSADIFQCHSEADKILVDEIFQTCPRMFYEVFTIHSFKNRQQFPLLTVFFPANPLLSTCELLSS